MSVGNMSVACPIKVVDVELSRPVARVEGLHAYVGLQALVRLHGVPLGYVHLPVHHGCCEAEALSNAINQRHGHAILRHLLSDSLAVSGTDQLDLPSLLNTKHPDFQGPAPTVTVVVCSRDRAGDLARCLESLNQLDYGPLDILVVDNAPSHDATERLVRDHHPQARYVCEPRPGLDWARNRGIAEARGEIIAFTDDDVIVDAGWVKALARAFAENPEVMAITGLVVPYELETEAQFLFERYGGFGRGFERHWYKASAASNRRVAGQHGGAGKFGTGANMAYRRSLFDEIGLFDPALDVGTVTNGGGDLEMFFRVLKEGYTLVYEPNAIVRHRHRREYARLRTQISNNGIGFYSYLVRSALAYPDERRAIIRFGLWWLWTWNVRRLIASLLGWLDFPRDLILAELHGSFLGLRRYRQSDRAARRIAPPDAARDARTTD
jgi:O-antigen biosynthesis protein